MKKNSALYFSVGLVVLLAIVILVFGMFFLNEKDPRETFNTFYLRFTQVSTLVLDDPVKVNGVKMGKVEDISLAGHRVVVRIRLRTDVKIPKDSEIRVQNIGIMGERQIGMILGDEEAYLPRAIPSTASSMPVLPKRSALRARSATARRCFWSR